MEPQEIVLILIALSYIIIGGWLYKRKGEESVLAISLFFIFSPIILSIVIGMFVINLLNQLFKND